MDQAKWLTQQPVSDGGQQYVKSLWTRSCRMIIDEMNIQPSVS